MSDLHATPPKMSSKQANEQEGTWTDGWVDVMSMYICMHVCVYLTSRTFTSDKNKCCCFLFFSMPKLEMALCERNSK